MRDDVRRQLLDVLVNFFSAPRRRVLGEPSQEIGDLGVVLRRPRRVGCLRLGAGPRRRGLRKI